MALSLRDENAKTLAALLGTDEAEAARLLNVRVLVTCDPGCDASTAVARSVISLLTRTVTGVTEHNEGRFAAELVVGAVAARLSSAPKIWVHLNANGATIGTAPGEVNQTGPVHGALSLLTACYASALVMTAAIPVRLPIERASSIRLDWKELFGPDLDFLIGPNPLGELYLAGAGAIGNAFLLALKDFAVSGTLYVCDPKIVKPGSFNRCLWFDESDLEKPKARQLCKRAQAAFRTLELVPVEGTLGQALKARGSNFRLERLVVGVDSRRARRSLQLDLPREVFDASTTDIREIVLHFNHQPTELACLSCTYPETERELSHERHVADALGVDVVDVQQEFVSEMVAAKICRAYPSLSPSTLIGRAFDSLFKELCGQGLLRAAGAQQVLAPFSFVSVLAGAYLAIEVARRCSTGVADRPYNYWRASPWHNPNLALRQMRERVAHCEFCGNPTLRAVNIQLWGAGGRRGMNASSPLTMLP